MAGVNENLAILLLAAKFGVPVCPHAGGVGLCEMVQHLAMFDFVAVSATDPDRVLEYVDHLHEHFTDPVRVTGGRYLRAGGAGLLRHTAGRVAARLRVPRRRRLAARQRRIQRDARRRVDRGYVWVTWKTTAQMTMTPPAIVAAGGRSMPASHTHRGPRTFSS